MSNSKKKLIKITGVLLLCVIVNTSFSDAHSGRTDSNGGHRDNKNKSGLGSYHFHHGYGPHLHTNGCPYAASINGSSDVGNSSSQASSSSSYQANIKKQEEAEKEQVRSKGYKSGYSDGYNGYESDSYYSGEYSDIYELKYDEGYAEGKAKLETEKDEAKEKGYKLGLEGLEINENQYENEVLNAIYKNFYNSGYTEYQSEKIKEYRDLGLLHGKSNEKMIDIEEIDDAFKASYIEAYNKGQKILSDTYIEKGYKSALKSMNYKVPNYTDTKFIGWYKEGFDKAISDIASATELGYNDGYSRNENKVPYNLIACESIYLENYEKGKEDRDRELGTGTLGITGIVGAGWITRRYKEAKKSIM